MPHVRQGYGRGEWSAEPLTGPSTIYFMRHGKPVMFGLLLDEGVLRTLNVCPWCGCSSRFGALNSGDLSCEDIQHVLGIESKTPSKGSKP